MKFVLWTTRTIQAKQLCNKTQWRTWTVNNALRKSSAFNAYTRLFPAIQSSLPLRRSYNSVSSEGSIDHTLNQYVETLVRSAENGADRGLPGKNLVSLLSNRQYSRAKYEARELLVLCATVSQRVGCHNRVGTSNAIAFIWKLLVELAPGLVDHFDSNDLDNVIRILAFLKQKLPQQESTKLTRSLLVSAFLSLEDISYRRQETRETSSTQQQRRRQPIRQSRSTDPWPLHLQWDSFDTVKEIVSDEHMEDHDLLFLSWLSSRMVYENLETMSDLPANFQEDIPRLFKRCERASHVTCTKRLRECVSATQNSTTISGNPGNHLITPLHLPVQIFSCLQNSQADFVDHISRTFPEDERLFLLQASAITGMFHRIQFIQVAKRWGQQFGHLPPRVLDDSISTAEMLVRHHEKCRKMLPSEKVSREEIPEEVKSLYFMCSALCHAVWIRLRNHYQENTGENIELAVNALELMLWVHEGSAVKQQHVVRLLYELRNIICTNGLEENQKASLKCEEGVPYELFHRLIKMFSRDFQLFDKQLWASIAAALEHHTVNNSRFLDPFMALHFCRNCVPALTISPRLTTTITQIIASLGNKFNERKEANTKDLGDILDQIGAMYSSCLRDHPQNLASEKVVQATDKLLSQLLRIYPLQAYASLPSLSNNALLGYMERQDSQVSHIQTFAEQAIDSYETSKTSTL